MSHVWEQQKSIAERDETIVSILPQIQISESLDDESSCSISGNEGILQYSKDSQTPSPPPLTSDKIDQSPFKPNPRTSSSTSPETSVLNTSSKANIEVIAPSATTSVTTALPTTSIKIAKSSMTPLNANIRSRSVSGTRKHPTIIENPIISHQQTAKEQSEFNLLYVGVGLAIALAVISVLLLLKINNIQSKPSFYYHDLQKHENGDVEVYAEWLKWQSEMQTKSIEEAEGILNTNLKEVIKVRGGFYAAMEHFDNFIFNFRSEKVWRLCKTYCRTHL